MRAVYELLGVDLTVADGIDLGIHNPFSQPRNPLAARAMSSMRTRAMARAVLPELLRARVERYVLVSRRKPPLAADLRERLQTLFESERPALEALLGLRLPW